LQGGADEIVEALERGDLAAAPVSEPERVLLKFVELVTRHAWRTTENDVEQIRQAGWTDEQIAEAVYITAMFAFFNRVADAFGLKNPNYRQLAPGQRPAGPNPIAAPDAGS
jgi:alkylhydroperoxidase family enzyme